jgi:hypothetical protein
LPFNLLPTLLPDLQLKLTVFEDFISLRLFDLDFFAPGALSSALDLELVLDLVVLLAATGAVGGHVETSDGAGFSQLFALFALFADLSVFRDLTEIFCFLDGADTKREGGQVGAIVVVGAGVLLLLLPLLELLLRLLLFSRRILSRCRPESYISKEASSR